MTGKGIKKDYSPDFRAEILEMVANGRKPAEIAREYDISPVTISNWHRVSTDPRHKPEQTEEQAENSRLRAENHCL